MAEREGFEPSIRNITVCLISSIGDTATERMFVMVTEISQFLCSVCVVFLNNLSYLELLK